MSAVAWGDLSFKKCAHLRMPLAHCCILRKFQPESSPGDVAVESHHTISDVGPSLRTQHTLPSTEKHHGRGLITGKEKNVGTIHGAKTGMTFGRPVSSLTWIM